MSEEKRSFSRIQVRLKAQARIMESLDSPQLFTGESMTQPITREDFVKKSKLPEEVTGFLVEMDRKLDQIISMLGQDTFKMDFSLPVEVMEISAAGVKFRSARQFHPGDALELIIYLSQTPLRLAGSKGRILDQEPDTGLYRFEFVDLRGSDMEAIVQFVFKEQREQIRNSKM
ncbi:PilZ domain protein [Pseudodesulfovibrio hydrargyri]|uniref:PilZ domain protein n=1 Tax=Pseudodesulfovibrio hydrargyri TaxID=2125990 RepID=A0A1J5MQI8_9BACT|nr:PilZ domain-containing protein [Pseudodesulfovibrio hydrargyri]OIQ48885.1 PilZ domain protein [Pseudodesulfovibrio hydrargyri]